MISLRIVASLVRAQPLPFLLNILRWLLVAIPATACNSLLSFIQSKLAIAYRTRLTAEVMKQYLGTEDDQSMVFYKMGELVSFGPAVDFLNARFRQRISMIAYRTPTSTSFVSTFRLYLFSRESPQNDYRGYPTIFKPPSRNLFQLGKAHFGCLPLQLPISTERWCRRLGSPYRACPSLRCSL